MKTMRWLIVPAKACVASVRTIVGVQSDALELNLHGSKVKNVFAALFALSLSATAMGQQQVTLTVGAGGSQNISPGDSITVDITSTDTAAVGNGIAAWSIAVGHDPAKLQIDSAVQGDLGPAGGSAGFENVSLISNSSGDGFINATILDFFGNVAFPGGGTQILSTASYTNLMVAAGDIANIEVVDNTLANVPSPPVAVSVSLFDGTAVDQASGALGIENLELVNVVPPPFQYSAEDVMVNAIIGSDPIEASVNLSIEQVDAFLGNASQDFAGFSMGVQHDDAQLEVLSVDPVAGVTDAASVAFFGATLLSNGFVLGVAAELDPMTPFADLNASSAIDVATAVYGPPVGAMPIGGEVYSSALEFVDTLTSTGGTPGSLPVVNEVVVDDGGSAVIAAVVTVNGSVELMASSTLDFIRGDCNDDGLLNIADGVTIIQNIVAQVASGGSAPALDCIAACDADGMTPMGGTQPISLNDAILVFAFTLGLDPADLSMFAPGAAVLPAPGSTCGQFSGQAPEDCTLFNSCP